MNEIDIVLPGFKIEIELVDHTGGREAMTVQIVPDASADLSRGYLGETTPLCQAIYGQPVGAEIAYVMGELRSVKILSATPTDDGPDPNVALRRAATLRKAVDQSDLTNAILFASSFNGKWGDYDPSGLIEERDKNDDEKPMD